MTQPTRRIVLLASAMLALGGPSRAQSVPPLVAAAEQGDHATIRRLISERAPLEARDANGRTALLAATHANRVEAARLLIAAGADVNAKDGIEDSPFLYAGAEGREEILQLTLPKADFRSVNRFGGTALIPAAHHGHVETVRILLRTPIALDHVNNLGWTALLEAVVLGSGGTEHTEIVRLLVEAGARIDIADRDGVTPLVHANRRGFRAIAEILAGGNRPRQPR